MSAIIAIPLHNVQSVKFPSAEKCAEYFKTTTETINDCINSGSALLLKNGKGWVFDEVIERGVLRVFRAADGEEVRLRGSKAFCAWSGYKSADALFQNQSTIRNKLNGKIYQVIREE